ncbi:SubName: Full=Uncharacterized protein {ECO:0000313/EMBL:CCA71325.1} [Serendipita indica DSM 11827]|uniref:Uncharacterized protein n=1 Tax=Serendipita indica (strain DSM 11827) TaxID=1109443 RepID=G4TJ23_SERID|nr:SubName: Full=Uncharacterized protein {ECO:0000313/EMBL:CCA71325.1} [Serendipita indica DSM 11827]CCA71325.1 hypothetical protein PIIN_05264 [Serendipita indica DSM 11827]
MSDNPTTPKPIPIHRQRSGSVSSVDDNVPELSPGSSHSQSPPSSPTLPRPALPSSPILSYFFNKDAASKSPSSLRPTIANMPGSVFEKDAANPPKLSPVLGHHRTMSMNSDWPRFSSTNPPQNNPAAKAAQDRGAGILRRLSLSGSTPFQRPAVPTGNSAIQDADNALTRSQTVHSTAATLPRSRPHGRRATLASSEMPKPRAPSPIGERMLKGHFDGFV